MVSSGEVNKKAKEKILNQFCTEGTTCIDVVSVANKLGLDLRKTIELAKAAGLEYRHGYICIPSAVVTKLALKALCTQPIARSTEARKSIDTDVRKLVENYIDTLQKAYDDAILEVHGTRTYIELKPLRLVGRRIRCRVEVCKSCLDVETRVKQYEYRGFRVLYIPRNRIVGIGFELLIRRERFESIHEFHYVLIDRIRYSELHPRDVIAPLAKGFALLRYMEGYTPMHYYDRKTTMLFLLGNRMSVKLTRGVSECLNSSEGNKLRIFYPEEALGIMKILVVRRITGLISKLRSNEKSDKNLIEDLEAFVTRFKKNLTGS